jgi:hypothetical protein
MWGELFRYSKTSCYHNQIVKVSSFLSNLEKLNWLYIWYVVKHDNCVSWPCELYPICVIASRITALCASTSLTLHLIHFLDGFARSNILWFLIRYQIVKVSSFLCNLEKLNWLYIWYVVKHDNCVSFLVFTK